MDDSGYYIGACPTATSLLDDAHAQYSALGYSGTNSGGHLIIQNSEFDHNKTGLSHQQPEQRRRAVAAGRRVARPTLIGPTGTNSCWIFQHNFVHDNNDANVPGAGSAELGPPGTGLVISGGRNDTSSTTTFTNNGSWAVLSVPFIDTGTPPPIAHCDGGVANWMRLGLVLLRRRGATRSRTTPSPTTAASATRPTATSATSAIRSRPSRATAGTATSTGVASPRRRRTSRPPTGTCGR